MILELNESKTNQQLSSESDLVKENIFLKEKLNKMEQKYNTLLAESNRHDLSDDRSKLTKILSNSTQTSPIETPKFNIYPPIKVRLQKLNEKRVALKWNHNPKNLLIELNGYNIYINGKLCGKMSPNDMIASINGIQEEGEYRIFIRSFCGDKESENSNQVVTRVKRKQLANDEEAEAEEEEEESVSASESELNDSHDKSSNQNSKFESSNSIDESKPFETSTDKIEPIQTSDSSSSINSNCFNNKLESKKDFLFLMKERLTGLSNQQEKEPQQTTSIANRIAKNAINSNQTKPKGYAFLTEKEKNNLLKSSMSSTDSSHSSKEFNKNYAKSKPFEGNNVLSAKKSVREPAHSHSSKCSEELAISKNSLVRQSILFDEFDNETAYLSNIKPIMDKKIIN